MTFLIVFAVWLILNGKITIEICVIGLLLSFAIAAFSGKFLAPDEKKKRSLKRIPHYLHYAALLVLEIAKANLQVLGLVISGKTDFEPKIVYFRTDLKENFNRVLLANSITLTPGTITVTLEDDLYCVHCLDRSMAEGIEESSFVRLLRRIEEV